MIKGTLMCKFPMSATDPNTVDPFAINDTTLLSLDAPLDSVKFPESSGGGYMANLAVFHQLHCLVHVDSFQFWYALMQNPEDGVAVYLPRTL